MYLIISKITWAQGSRMNQYIFSAILTLPILSFGMSQAWMAPMISVLKSDHGPSSGPYTLKDISWASAVTYVTAVSLGLPMGYITDKFGRKFLTMVTILSLVVYWLIKIISLEPWALILARAVVGFTCSSCYVTLPAYIKEITDIDIRGSMGSLLILNRNLGYVLSYVGCDLLSVDAMLRFGLIIPAVNFFLMLFLPESPEYLVKRGKIDEAKSVMAWLRGTTVTDPTIQRDINNSIDAQQCTKEAAVPPWKMLFIDQPTRRAFTITMIIKMAQQFDGFLIVIIYSGYIFEKASEHISLNISPNKQIVMIGVVNLLGSVLATSILEKTGRKLLLVVTSFAVGAGMLLLAVWFYLMMRNIWVPGWIPVFALCLCMFADAGGFQPTSYIIITDLFTFQLRSTVLSITNVFAKFGSFVQMMWFNELCSVIGFHWTFFGLAVVCIFCGIYTIIEFPETRNKTVEEIYSKLSKKNKIVPEKTLPQIKL